MLLILAALTSASLLMVRRRVQQQLRGQLRQDLRNSVATFQNVQNQRVLALRHSAQLLADLPISRALMTTGHAATIQDVSKDLWRIAGTDLLVLADPRGKIMGLHSGSVLDRGVIGDFMERSLARGQSDSWWMAGKHLYEVSVQPVYFGPPAANRLVGYVALGWEIDDRTARELSEVAASQVAFWYGGALVRSTLPLPDQAEYQRLRSGDRGQGAMDAYELRIGPETYLVTSVELTRDATPEVRLAVLKSLEQSNAFLGDLNQLLAGLGLIAVLAGSAVVFFISRTFTRPLDQLVAGVRALGRGEYAYPLSRHEGEIAELTTAFSTMRTSLQQSQRELLDAERLATIGRMASSISHDLRHQLAAILANAEFLSERRSESERQELYEELRSAVTQMTDLIDSLLEFSRPRESLRLSKVPLDEVVERAVQTIRSRPEFREVSITNSLPAVEGWFDSSKLQRVFQNLIINACESTAANGKITISGRQNEHMAEIVVEDNGRGIPDHVKGSIFEPFVSYGKENGTGLGLTVVHKIVQDHGGEIGIERTSPDGTVMVVKLPLLTSPEVILGLGTRADVVPARSTD